MSTRVFRRLEGLGQLFRARSAAVYGWGFFRWRSSAITALLEAAVVGLACSVQGSDAASEVQSFVGQVEVCHSNVPLLPGL